MTKTPAEIKRALQICADPCFVLCEDCPYWNSFEKDCEADGNALTADALDYIEQLEAENTKLKAESDKIANKIIHCKDCVHAHFTSDGTRGFCEYWDDNENGLTVKLCLQGDDFCPHGQRRKA